MPTIDPIPLPAPVPLLVFLLLLTFFLHLLAMNLTLGGSIIAVVSHWIGKRRDSEPHRQLFRRLVRALPVAVSFTITLGVAPLLFLQVLYGPAFYTSSILMAWPWLSVIAILIIAYYAVYYAVFKAVDQSTRALRAVTLSAAIFIVIALLYVNNMVLMLLPGIWKHLYAADPTARMLRIADPIVLPRFLHMLTGAVAVGGLWVTWFGLAARGEEQAAERTFLLQTGLQWFAVATLVNFVVGPLLLLHLPIGLYRTLLGSNPLLSSLLFAAVALAIAAFVCAAVSLRGKTLVPLTVTASVCTLITVAAMVVIRHTVRQFYLRGQLDINRLPVALQTAIFLVFFMLLLAGAGVVGWMLYQIRIAGRAEGVVAAE